MVDIIVAVVGSIIVVAGIAWGIVWELKPSVKEDDDDKKGKS